MWCNPPFHNLLKFLRYAVQQVLNSPSNTEVFFVIPYWPNSLWWPIVIEHFDHISTIPAGSHLFTAPHHLDVTSRMDCGPTQWDTWIIKTKTVTSRDKLTNIKSIINSSSVSASELFDDKSLDEALKFAEAPTSFPESQERPDAKLWKAATIKELDTLVKNDSWWNVIKSKIPSGFKVLPSRFVYRVKFNKLGEILKYKARLVVKGYAQIFGQDYFATFAPVAQLTSLRILLIICAQLSLTTFHIDFEAAFVQSDIDTDICVSYPQVIKCRINMVKHYHKITQEFVWLKTGSKKLEHQTYYLA